MTRLTPCYLAWYSRQADSSEDFKEYIWTKAGDKVFLSTRGIEAKIEVINKWDELELFIRALGSEDFPWFSVYHDNEEYSGYPDKHHHATINPTMRRLLEEEKWTLTEKTSHFRRKIESCLL